MNRLASTLMFLAAVCLACAQDETVAPLPAGVRPVWDVALAHHETTPTREKICINGLWRWQPSTTDARSVPASGWGFFKVPGCWPGITDYMQKDSQSVIAHPAWKNERLGAVSAAWYQREIAIPREWAGRRITLTAEYVNSVATVFVDGVKRGEIRFPAGELDLTSACPPGSTHLLSLHVVALPLKAVLLSYADTNTAREVKSRVARRGLCGDVFLVSTPPAARIEDVKIDPSVRRKEITFDVGLAALAPERSYLIDVQILQGGRTVATFSSDTFGAEDAAGGRFQFTREWKPAAQWDTHTPENMLTARCTLGDADGALCDVAFGARFGFREFWIDGRDFYLNGTRLGLSVVPLDNAQVGAALATYEAARESLLRLKGIGINFVYTHNYGCEPGSHLSFEEILRAADDVGMLVALSQPHFSHYDWKAADADETNGYARHAAFYVRVAQNHPCVVAYAMNHNSTGYSEDMNPDLIDGIHDPRDAPAQRNAKLALRAEAIVRKMDASRVIYHHSSGNLGAMHTINFYPNFVPSQELSDWFEHWATTGVKPVFLCEYGAPFTWDWTMYRGWYKGERAFGDAAVPWQFSLAEWNAQFVGDRAFQISRLEADNLRWEAKQLQAGKVWHRWDYPHEVSSRDFDERYPIFAQYLADNWPAFRTWGVSAFSPWEYGHFWKLRPGVDKRRQELAVDWTHLQRPGFSPDFIEGRYERMDLAFAREDWIATPAAEALLRYNQPLLAYLAGKPAAFTSKDHLFVAGETFEKQLIAINNSRERVTADATWSLALPQPIEGKTQLALAPGEQRRVPLRFALPRKLPPRDYAIAATIRFSTGETQTDSFRIDVVPASAAPPPTAKLALFDPKGETAAELKRLGIVTEAVTGAANLADYDVLIVGKRALTLDSAAPDITRVRDGLKAIIFEQAADVLEKRFGFRIAEYGLRRAFPRIPDHPVLAGIVADDLRDWRGEATLLSPRLTYETRPRFGPIVRWCDMPVTRLWRCGNRGNIASVLLEKPARGDFRSLVDGGFDLQYSTLLEYREGRGAIWFCQLDVTGRTETEPVAAGLVANLLRHASEWKPAAARVAVYVGEPAGKTHLAAAGFEVKPYGGDSLAPNQVLVLGPGATREQFPDKAAASEFLAHGGRIVTVGLNQSELDAVLPMKVTVAAREHISSYFDPQPLESPFAGIGPADALNRAPCALPLVTAGAEMVGDGVFASTANGHVVLCAMAPWQFAPDKQSNLKRTFRRATAALTRVLANQGVGSTTPVLERFHSAVAPAKNEPRWLHGLYLDTPEEWDDPYRFFRW